MALTALAGPVSNLLLALLAMLLGRLVYECAPYTPFWDGLLSFLLLQLAPLSVGLGLFNLLPIPPLDGSKVLAMFLPDRAYVKLMRYERYGIIVLLLLSWFGLTGNLISNIIMAVYNGLFNLCF